MNTFDFPWAIVGRCTPFHPFVTVERWRNLERAIYRMGVLKRTGRWYSMAVRAA